MRTVGSAREEDVHAVRKSLVYSSLLPRTRNIKTVGGSLSYSSTLLLRRALTLASGGVKLRHLAGRRSSLYSMNRAKLRDIRSDTRSFLQGGAAAAALAGLFYGLGDVYGDQI